MALGYIGVVNSPTKTNQTAMLRSEQTFFKNNPDYDPTMVGSGTLRKKLMLVLGARMSNSLGSIVETVRNELDEARYQFKVHYNDRTISPESYVAECIDILKAKFKEFARQFDKQLVKEEIRLMLLVQMSNLLEENYWSKDGYQNFAADCSGAAGDAKLFTTSSKLTRSGVGKASVNLVVDMISRNLGDIVLAEPWLYHEEARKKVLEFATELLHSKYLVTIDQVENTIKPYKLEVDVSDSEWKSGQESAVKAMTKKLNEIQHKINAVRSKSGRRKHRNAIKYLNFVNSHPTQENSEETVPFSELELHQAREAISNQGQMRIISQRLAALNSSQCGSVSSKACCPEIYLSVVAEKLASTAVMFIYVELLNEFFFQLPRQIDNKMYYSLNRSDIATFCKENPAIDQHLTIQERKQTLEVVMEKLLLIASKSV